MSNISITVGTTGQLKRTIKSEHCIRRGAYEVFSTPQMVSLLEETSMEVLSPFLEGDQESVGSRVDVKHLAASLIGQTVIATATVSGVDGRRVTFEVSIEDELENVGTATHERFVVDVPSFEERLLKKSKQISGLEA